HFNLGAFEGMARLRFRFGSDGADVREGWYIDDVVLDGYLIDYTDIAQQTPTGAFIFGSADPNPFMDRTAFSYRLPTVADVQLQVFDLGGRLVRTLVAGQQQPGLYQIGWDGRDESRRLLPAGIYMTRLHAGPDQATGKVILTR
ncbi:MAG: T9SS type A sorting domain-containing protein, partial [bacterium]|nr:T9SS type A sorting domain-containing protein [bacterium]